MKLNRFMIVSIILLAIISIGAASAASDNTTADDAVGVTEELNVSASDVDEIATDGGDAAIGSDVTSDSKLGVSAEDEKLSAGTVTPDYTVEVKPDVMDGTRYVAQYGQVITVNGTLGNATGSVSIRFGYVGHYFDYDVPLVDGKFSKDITDYGAVRNNYQITVTYSGDDYYRSLRVLDKYIHVKMENVTANDAYYGLNPYMDVNLFDATGNVTFTLNGKTYTKKLENGKTTQEFTNYTLGSNTVTMKYEGDGVINPIEKSFTFNVDANVDAPTIYNYQPAIVNIYFGHATGKVNVTFNNKTEELEIVGGVATTELKDYAVGDNTFEIAYSGDDTFNPFETTETLTVLAKEDATIISSVYQTASQNFIFINVPYANGTINVTVNGKKEVWELVNGSVKKEINATDKINELTVSYEGNVRLNPTTSSFYVNLTDYVVNNKTFRNYFDISNGGKLYDFIEDGVTLDFQGIVFINTNSENEVNIEISKPINIISSTNDAYIDLNTTAGSLLGEHPGSSFIVGRAGSGSNISGIKLHNTELWISNTTNVVFDNISVVVEDQRVGSGNGATSVRDNSSYVTIKNSYFYTRNNGGSTTFTFAWASYCTFDNNTVVAEGNVGNLLYLNVYNIINLPGPTKESWGDILPDYPLNNHNVFSNNELFGKEGSAISVGIMVEGEYNVIANNTLHRTSISTSSGATGANNNTYYGNVLEAGSSFTAQTYSIIYSNYVPGSFSTGQYSVAYNNTIGGTMSMGIYAEAYNNTCGGLSATQNAKVHNNTITGSFAIPGENVEVYNNVITATSNNVRGKNLTMHGNVYAGNIMLSGTDCELYDNQFVGQVSISVNTKFYGNIVNGTFNANNNAIVYNNTILSNNQMNLNYNNVNFYENLVYGTTIVVGSNGKFTNNTVYSTEDYAVIINSNVDNANVRGNAIYSDKYCGDEAVSSQSSTSIVEGNYPISANFTVDMPTSFYLYDNPTITITLDSNATGEVYILFNNKKFNVNLNDNNVGTITFDSQFIGSGKNALTGKHNLFVGYEGDDKYGYSKKSFDIEILKYDLSFEINKTEPVIGNDLEITLYMRSNCDSQLVAPGTPIYFIMDGKEYVINKRTLDNVNRYAYAVLTIENICAGTHTMSAYYEGNYRLNAALYSESFTLDKSNPTVDIAVDELKIGEDVDITVTIVDATGKVNIIVDGVENSVDLVNGVASYTISNVTAGDHSIVAIYDGDAKNEASSNSTSFTLNKATPSVDVAIADLKLGEDATVTVTVANATGKVNIIVDGVESAVDLVDGVATATISKVTAGTHTVVANYAGDAKNNAAYGSASKTLTVLSTEITDVVVDGDLNINAVLKDSTGKGVEGAIIFYKIGTQNVTNITTGVNGTFTIKGEENAKVEISFAGSDLLFPSSTVISLSDVAPTRVVSVIDASQLTCYAIDSATGEKGAMFKVTLSDASGKLVNATVQFALDGKIYNATTDANGVASVQVNINKANTYTCAVSYLGDIKHDAAFAAVKVVVNKKKTKLTAKKKTFKAKVKTKKYTATLKTTTKSVDGKTYFAAGKKVTLKVKGKTYTAKTNKKGKVTFKIKKLTKKGKHTATIKFAGDSTYKGVTKKVKITIK